MRIEDKAGRPWRLLWVFPAVAFAILSIVATGGGGGGGGGNNGGFDDDDGVLIILPTYNFFMTNLPGDNLLTVNVGEQLTATIDIDGLFGSSVDLDVHADGSVTFLTYAARSNVRFELTVATAGGSPFDGTMAVMFTEDLVGNVGEPPTSGAFNVVAAPDTVSVTVTATGVSLSLNGGAAVDYTWEELGNLIDDAGAEAWEQRASLAASAVQFMYELLFMAADTLDDLEAATFVNPAIANCDMFTGTPPAGTLAQGQVTLTWLGSQELLPGDDFDWQFNQCWIDDPNSTTDQLIDGSISLEEYTEAVDTMNQLFEIGFGSLSGQPGGVFIDLTISETVENAGVFTILPENVVTVSGGFAMVIQAP